MSSAPAVTTAPAAATPADDADRAAVPPPALGLPDKPARQVHIPALDGLRGLAILLVLVFHFTGYDGDATGLRKLIYSGVGLGWVGVDLFFVLSGFLITGILLDAKGTAGYFKNFYMRRVLRIFPLYYGVLIVAFLIVPVFHPYESPVGRNIAADQHWLWLYFSNFVNIDWGPFTHFWSLAVEEQFYLLWPTVVFVMSRRPLMRLCVALMVGAFALRVGRVMNEYPFQATYYATFCRMDALAAGALLACAARGPGGIRSLIPYAKWVAAACGLVLLALLAKNRGNFWFGDKVIQTAGHSVLALLFASLLVLAITAPAASLLGRFCTNGVLRFFGKYSYGLYVFHGLLVLWIERALPIERLAASLGSWYAGWAAHVLIGSAMALTMALVSWHLYEKQFLKLKRFFEYRGAGKTVTVNNVAPGSTAPPLPAAPRAEPA